MGMNGLNSDTWTIYEHEAMLTTSANERIPLNVGGNKDYIHHKTLSTLKVENGPLFMTTTTTESFELEIKGMKMTNSLEPRSDFS